MTGEFDGPRTAIVTGGARRIGAELCRFLAGEGWHVLIHCLASGDEAERLAAELGNSKVVIADLAGPGAAEAIVAALAGLPPAGLLVNNASLFSQDSAEDFTPELWDRHQAINLRAPALLAQAFARQLDGRGGLIINMLDAKLANPNSDFFSYSVSKFGLAGLTELQARAYAPRRIRVCGIAPSVTLLSGQQSQENFDAVHRLNALGRGVTTADIVRAMKFILESPVLTGQTIILDGGQRFLGLARDVQFLEPK
jgi:NAD(P)-dependent dehydrogenase (short-subunit alcohol dehydrogenase family)